MKPAEVSDSFLLTDRELRLRAEESREGWRLIRGALPDWNYDSELREVEGYSDEVDRFGDAWIDFYNRRGETMPEDEPVSDWLMTVRMLESRQISLLDAIRATNMIGRPAAGSALLRSMYEGFLYILLVGFDTGAFEQKYLRAEEALHPTTDTLGRRFQAFGHHARLMMWESLRERGGHTRIESWPDGEEALETLGSAARAEFGFSLKKNTWHPFKSIWHMRNHLWPEGEPPRFPTEGIPLDDYYAWRGMYSLCYTEASHAVHNSSACHAMHEMSSFPGESGWVLAGRQWDSKSLYLAKGLAELSCAAIAAAEGHTNLWLTTLDEHGFFNDLGDDEYAAEEPA